MPYIGNPIYQAAFVTDQFSGDGTTTAFTMSVAPAGTSNVLVVVSGVVQDPSTYGVVGTTLTFTGAPPSGTGNISCRYLGVPATGVTTTAYRTVTEFTATAAQTTFTPPSYDVGFINVYRNGVLLGSADYTATNGTTVVLATGATAGDLVTVESFLISSVANAISNTAGSVNSNNIADGAVGTAELADAGVTAAKLAATTGSGSVVLTTGPSISNAVMSGMASSVITSGTVVSASTTSVTITGIPSWAKRITFMLRGVSSSGGSNWVVQLGTSGGITTSGYLGSAAYMGATNSCGGTNYTTGFGIQNGGPAQVFHGQLVLSLFDASSNVWIASGVYGDSSQAYMFTTGGSIALSGVATQIRIAHTNPADSFDAGSFNILYE